MFFMLLLFLEFFSLLLLGRCWCSLRWWLRDAQRLILVLFLCCPIVVTCYRRVSNEGMFCYALRNSGWLLNHFEATCGSIHAATWLQVRRLRPGPANCGARVVSFTDLCSVFSLMRTWFFIFGWTQQRELECIWKGIGKASSREVWNDVVFFCCLIDILLTYSEMDWTLHCSVEFAWNYHPRNFVVAVVFQWVSQDRNHSTVSSDSSFGDSKVFQLQCNKLFY